MARKNNDVDLTRVDEAKLSTASFNSSNLHRSENQTILEICCIIFFLCAFCDRAFLSFAVAFGASRGVQETHGYCNLEVID